MKAFFQRITGVKPRIVTDEVWVKILLDRPLQSISRQEQNEKPWVKITGLSFDGAAHEIPGKSIDWHSIPMSIRAKWEMPPFNHEMKWEDFKRWIR